mmetsp:Transcript_27733/g.41265  ORF Transcript_27733/g.41265 Transcript_27733/m.41265 type:complete len:94 (-) Transcript_27733:161-442(-)
MLCMSTISFSCQCKSDQQKCIQSNKSKKWDEKKSQRRQKGFTTQQSMCPHFKMTRAQTQVKYIPHRKRGSEKVKQHSSQDQLSLLFFFFRLGR